MYECTMHVRVERRAPLWRSVSAEDSIEPEVLCELSTVAPCPALSSAVRDIHRKLIMAHGICNHYHCVQFNDTSHPPIALAIVSSMCEKKRTLSQKVREPFF